MALADRGPLGQIALQQRAVSGACLTGLRNVGIVSASGDPMLAFTEIVPHCFMYAKAQRVLMAKRWCGSIPCVACRDNEKT